MENEYPSAISQKKYDTVANSSHHSNSLVTNEETDHGSPKQIINMNMNGDDPSNSSDHFPEHPSPTSGIQQCPLDQSEGRSQDNLGTNDPNSFRTVRKTSNGSGIEETLLQSFDGTTKASPEMASIKAEPGSDSTLELQSKVRSDMWSQGQGGLQSNPIIFDESDDDMHAVTAEDSQITQMPFLSSISQPIETNGQDTDSGAELAMLTKMMEHQKKKNTMFARGPMKDVTLQPGGVVDFENSGRRRALEINDDKQETLPLALRDKPTRPLDEQLDLVGSSQDDDSWMNQKYQSNDEDSTSDSDEQDENRNWRSQKKKERNEVRRRKMNGRKA
jgi:hypothetical protein